MKIFEIPIYALSKETLSKRVKEHIKKIEIELGDVPKKTLEKRIERETFPYKAWDYNHIVGYITISIHNRDVLFDVYHPYPEIKKYYWNTNRKKFVRYDSPSGFHFRVDEKMNNADISKGILDFVDEIKGELIPQSYYVDCEAFNALVCNVDYKSIIERG